MNRVQRRVHAGVWTMLGAALLVLLVIAVASRPRDGDAGGDRSRASDNP